MKILEIISMTCFVIYLLLQISHSKYMWYFYIPSCIAQAILYFQHQTWAFGVLNVYYIVMGVVGIINWRKDSQKAAGESENSIPLNKMTPKIFLISLGIAAVGIPALYFILQSLGDARPLLDAITSTLSIIATWWLTRSYIQQWILWIISDIFAVALNLHLGMYFLALQFSICIVFSIFGIINWYKKGVYVG